MDGFNEFVVNNIRLIFLFITIPAVVVGFGLWIWDRAK